MAVEARLDEDAWGSGADVNGSPPLIGSYLPKEEEVGRGGGGEDDFVSVDDGDGVIFLFADGCKEWSVVLERRNVSWTVSSCTILAMMVSRGAARASGSPLSRMKVSSVAG